MKTTKKTIMNFKSKLEYSTYHALIEHGLEVDYEPITITLFPSLLIPNKIWEQRGDEYKETTGYKIRSIKYIPDFVAKDRT